MILDCVDWGQISESKEGKSAAMQNVGNMYDLLYQVYCAKLTQEGSELAQENALRDFISEGKK